MERDAALKVIGGRVFAVVKDGNGIELERIEMAVAAPVAAFAAPVKKGRAAKKAAEVPGKSELVIPAVGGDVNPDEVEESQV
jgi:hypothetical protein